MKAEVVTLAEIAEEPALAELTEDKIEELAEKAAESFRFGSNMRGSAQYRQHLAYVLVKRGLKKLWKEEA